MLPDFIFNLTPGDLVYDCETYPNIFSVGFTHVDTGQKWDFEISFRRNDIIAFCSFMSVCNRLGNRWVGFNNIGFDYPIMHYINSAVAANPTAADIYTKAMSIIDSPRNARFAHMVWESDWLVNQVDLYKVHHFDNVSKATSLKVLEFNMRMDSVEDLPFPVGTILTDDQATQLVEYQWHDIDATVEFYRRSQKQLALRAGLSKKFGTNMTNMSDIKIGETILVAELEKAGVACYTKIDGRKAKRQTKRESIDLREVIFPYVSFELPAFQNIQSYLSARVIKETKGVFTDLAANVDGLEYSFGTGGLHASVEAQTVSSTDTMQLVDVDVASFYPNLGIKNNLYPAHLGEAFCDAYLGVYQTRKTYPKKTAENEAFKLALNGAYGGSNNEYSPFLDPFYTMSITINGQLLLCMLIEQMLKVPGLKMIQANTDGITYLCPREHLDHTRAVCRWWEELTSLELEEALYRRMFIRDVNNYVAEYESGDLKRIGAYAYVTAEEDPGTRELPYHKDWSARVVAKAAEAALVDGVDVATFIRGHDDIYDFFLRTKVPRSSTLEWGGEQVSNIVRYYISTGGRPLEKVMPPAGEEGQYKRANKLTDDYFNSVLAEIGPGTWDERIHTKNKSTYAERRSGVQTGWTVELCNDITNAEWGNCHPNDLNHDWYIQQALKLVEPLRKQQ